MPSHQPGDGAAFEEPTDFLAGQAREGDRRSFAGLYERVGPALHAWVRIRSIGSLQGRAEPDEIMQAIWLRALEKIGSYDPAKGEFRGWIFRVARNVMYEFHRAALDREARQQPMPDQASMAAWASTSTSVSRCVARSEIIRRFIDRASRLDREDRALIVLRALEGLSLPAVAVHLGITPEAAKKRWQRLREDLLREEFPEGFLAACGE